MFRHAARANLARVGDFDRSQFPFVARAAMAAVTGVKIPIAARFPRAAINAVTTPKTPRKPRTGFGDIDPTAAGRAAAASAAVFSRYQGLIDAIAKDPSLTPDQRAAAIHSLRQQQTAEAAAAHGSIMDEERAAARARRNMEKNTP
jgi:hypothetical protein